MGYIWSDSFLLPCGGLHWNQLPKYLTAVSEDLINRVKRAWCLNAIPIHRYLQCLSCHRVCQISSGVIWSRAMLPLSCAFCSGSWEPSRNLKKQCKSRCGQLNEALLCTHITKWRDLLFLNTHYCLLPETGQCTQWTFDLTTCNHFHFSVKMTMGFILRLSCYKSHNFLQINSLLQLVYWERCLRWGFTVPNKITPGAETAKHVTGRWVWVAD